jgi:DNA-directed RNA polymerase specialized sigma24 family protein
LHLYESFAPLKSHEELFLEHYDWLIKWALQLSHGQREDALDLVHDLYLHLVQSRPSIEFGNSDRVRGYLYTMLRNLGVSKARRAGRDALSTLTIVDYDSLEFGMTALDRSQLLLVRSDLARACEYACRRRHSSRAASVLILRFFLGYFPGEIRSILQTSRVAVEKHLQVARQEARAYVRRPGCLRFLGHDVTPAPGNSVLLPDDPIALFRELQRRIFADPAGNCVDSQVIVERYTGQGLEMNAPELAHIVSCVRCLEQVNRILSIPPLSERLPSDSIDGDRRGGPPIGPTDCGLETKVLRRKLRQSYEHQPQKLEIAVDGEICAAHRISGARNELQVRLDPLAKPSFLEVFSEQQVRLLYLQIDGTDMSSPQPQVATAELSDGRSIELQLTIAAGTSLVTAVYEDPQRESCAEEGTVGAAVQPFARFVNDAPGKRSRRPSLAAFVLRSLRSLFQRHQSLLPLGIAVGLATLALLTIHVVRNRPGAVHSSMPTAAGLLAESRAREASRIVGGGAVHTTFSLETLSSKGRLLDRQTVERWSSLEPDRRALRLLNDRGELMAGSWSDAGGKVTTYPSGHDVRKGTHPHPEKAAFASAWEMTPGEAAALSMWSEMDAASAVRPSASGYEIEYERPHEPSKPGVVHAKLVLDGSSLEPLREEITLEENGETREYRFQQLAYEIVPQREVRDDDFSPPATLTRLSPGLVGGSREQGSRLMLAALEVLDHLGPDTEEFVDVDRLPDGRVDVSGVLPTNAQQDSIARLFLPLRREGRLHLDLHSNQGMSIARTPTDRPLQIDSTEPVPVESAKIPFDRALRAGLSVQGIAGTALEDRVRELAGETVDDVSMAHREAWNIQQIAAEDFNADDLAHLQPKDQALWLALLRRHTQLLDRELARLDMDLEFLRPRHPQESGTLGGEVPLLTNTTELAGAAKQLTIECGRLDHLVTAGMTLSPSSATPTPSIAETAELLANIRARERVLSATVARLSTAAPADRWSPEPRKHMPPYINKETCLCTPLRH